MLEVASTAAAKWGWYPVFFMAGMVSAPVVTVLAMEDPEIIPNRAEEKTLTLAGPPAYRPATQEAKSIKN